VTRTLPEVEIVKLLVRVVDVALIVQVALPVDQVDTRKPRPEYVIWLALPVGGVTVMESGSASCEKMRTSVPAS
jgi:hypothetical protein